MVKAVQFTRQGKERSENQDYATCFIDEEKELWVIADGATNAAASGEFVRTYCESLMTLLCAMPLPWSHNAILTCFKTLQSRLQRHFICARGSFLLLVIEHQQATQHCFYLGDCRLGISQAGDITWMTQPHSLAVVEGITDEVQLCQAAQRHLLFKQLSVRRYIMPEYRQLTLPLDSPIILATDGFWSQHPATITIDPQTMATTADDLTLLIRLPVLNNSPHP